LPNQPPPEPDEGLTQTDFLFESSQPQCPLPEDDADAEADALLLPPLEDEEALALTQTDFLFESSQLQWPPPLEAEADALALALLLLLLPPSSAFLAPVSAPSLLSVKQLCRWLHLGVLGAPSGQATRRQRAEMTPRPSLASF
jgi:hypothetical protein